MNQDISNYAPSKQIGIKTLYEACKILKENGGELKGSEIVQKISERLEFNEWEKETYERGDIRWQKVMHFYSIDLVKAGYIRKKSGIWYLTDEGESALKKGPIYLFESALEAYKNWRKANPKKEQETQEVEELDDQEQLQKATLDQLEEEANDGLREAINQLNPYEFQELIAALLRSMGYYTPFTATRGKDGGIDIIAYKDPLGVEVPKIKVQVKHYPTNPIAVKEIRSLVGILNGNTEVGIFVTSGSFSSEAKRFARESNTHIELIDFEKLIGLWKSFYSKMSDEDKNILPLQAIYFLGTNE